jgi:hypothetical protein
LRIIAVSRFSSVESRGWFDAQAIETLPCDLLNRAEIQKLPDAPNLFYLVGLKFGTQQNPALTWAVNTLVPAHVCERYPQSTIVALSTGNVYPFVPVTSGGSRETDTLTPLGEYPNAAVARERIFGYFSHENATRITTLRLNYAMELRYGVLLDVAQKVWMQKPIDVSMGYLNCIWQGDANAFVVRSLALAASPPAVFNMTGAQVLSVRHLAERFGELLDRRPDIVGRENESALLSNSSRLFAELGEPATPLEQVVQWVAHWVKNGGRTFGKPTHFETRDGKY